MRIFTILLLASFAPVSAVVANAQAAAPTQPPVVIPKQPATTLPKADGTHLSVVSDVSGSVSVEAVLLPPSVAQRIFGKAISDNYAAVQITISNHNPDAALLLQSAFLDYSHWLFSNNFQSPLPQDQSIKTTSFEQADQPNQVASTESRLVRSDLQDAQYWTARNGFIRAATFAGTVASSLQFLTSNAAALSGIAAYGNQIVPALVALWPDRVQLQINRISDFGFQTNHVIPKESSDIVVAFFPIDRFLTPSLRKIYLKAPAVFFVPGEMLIDAKYTKVLAQLLRSTGVMGSTLTDQEVAANVTAALGHYEAIRAKMARCVSDPSKNSADVAKCSAEEAAKLSDDDGIILEILKKVSLNNIRLIVSGVMTVDTNSVPAIIDTVSYSDGTSAASWQVNNKTPVTVTINGSFLTNGVPSFLGNPAGVGSITVDAKDSTDKKLIFSFPITATIPSGTILKLVVTKKANDGTTTTSKESDYTVTYPSSGYSVEFTGSGGADSANQEATWEGTAQKPVTLTGTITGSNLTDAVASFTTPPTGVGKVTVDTKNSTDTKLVFTFPLTATIKSGTVLKVSVSTKAADGTTTSKESDYTVTYPSSGYSVEFTGSGGADSANQEATWEGTAQKPVTLTGTITGSNLTDAVASFTTPPTGVGKVTVDTKNSTDTKLVFTFPLTATIKSGTVLKVSVSTKAADGTTTSKESDYTVKHFSINSVTFTSAGKTKGAIWQGTAQKAVTVSCTITGSLLTDAVPSFLTPPTGVGKVTVDTKNSTDSKLIFRFPVTATIKSGTVLKISVATKAADGKSTNKESDQKITY